MPYASTPVLLEPFARPCSVNGRTLSRWRIDAWSSSCFVAGNHLGIGRPRWGVGCVVPGRERLERRTPNWTLLSGLL